MSQAANPTQTGVYQKLQLPNVSAPFTQKLKTAVRPAVAVKRSTAIPGCGFLKI